jgi:hypothetical protein
LNRKNNFFDPSCSMANKLLEQKAEETLNGASEIS